MAKALAGSISGYNENQDDRKNAKFIISIGIMIAMAGSRNLVAGDPMAVGEQNAMIGKYCAVCHTDAVPNGGLSLQHFDAAHPDPQLAAMLASKLKARAIGAAGLRLPDRATQDALLLALSAEAAGADQWHVERLRETVNASVLRETPSHIKNAKDPDLYRLTLICDAANRQGEMQLAWSPAVPENGQTISAAVDGQTPVEYKVSAGCRLVRHKSIVRASYRRDFKAALRLDRMEPVADGLSIAN